MTALPKTQHLVIFQEVVRCGGIRAAARSLGQTQPTITKAMSDLESQLGVELFNRHHSGVELTEAGRVFLSHSHYVVKELHKSLNEIQQFNKQNIQELSFGFSSLIAFTFLPQLVAELKKSYKDLHLSFKEAQLSTLLPALRENHLDFAIGTITDDMPLQDFNVVPLFEAHFSVITHPEHPLANCQTLESFKHVCWVLPSTDMGYYNKIFNLLESRDMRLNRMVSSDSIVTILNLIAQGAGATILAKEMAIPFGLQGCFKAVALSEALPTAKYALVWHKNRRPPAILDEVIHLVKHYSSQRDW